jgi:hypothetical protein
MSASPGASHPLVAAWLATTRRRGGAATSGALAWEAALDGTRAFRPGPGGLALTCRHGTFLVTQAGDPEDHVLEAGGTFATGSPGLVVAWALRAGVLVARAGGAHQPGP